jgi:hypothetical protein
MDVREVRRRARETIGEPFVECRSQRCARNAPRVREHEAAHESRDRDLAAPQDRRLARVFERRRLRIRRAHLQRRRGIAFVSVRIR